MCSILQKTFCAKISFCSLFQNRPPSTRKSHCFRFRVYSSSSIAKKKSSSSKVQTLYGLCKSTFTSTGNLPPPSSQAVQKLCSLLDTIGPGDVGLEVKSPDDNQGHGIFGLNNLSRVARWAQPITYLDMHECDSFTMCMFCFPTSAVIPLHDHPKMTVFSKLLYGSLHVKSYDWVEPSCVQESKGYPVRLAKLVVDKVLTAPCTSILYPETGGNLHCFTAITPCAILDVLSPPYREDVGRSVLTMLITRILHLSIADTGDGDEKIDGDGNDYAWLAEVQTPDDLYMRPGIYNAAIQPELIS